MLYITVMTERYMDTRDRIRILRSEAASAGDLDTVQLCDRALFGDRAAIVDCERLLAAADAMDDES